MKFYQSKLKLLCKNPKSIYCNSDLDIWPQKSLGFFFLWVTISLLSMMKFHQSKLKLLCRNARSIYGNSDLNFSPMTSKINRLLPLKNIYQCTKFDEIPPKQTKVIVRKPMYYGQADGHTNRQTGQTLYASSTICCGGIKIWSCHQKWKSHMIIFINNQDVTNLIKVGHDLDLCFRLISEKK